LRTPPKPVARRETTNRLPRSFGRVYSSRRSACILQLKSRVAFLHRISNVKYHRFRPKLTLCNKRTVHAATSFEEKPPYCRRRPDRVARIHHTTPKKTECLGSASAKQKKTEYVALRLQRPPHRRSRMRLFLPSAGRCRAERDRWLGQCLDRTQGCKHPRAFRLRVRNRRCS
jgi:hypothetical protein